MPGRIVLLLALAVGGAARADSPTAIHRDLAGAPGPGLGADEAGALVERGLQLAGSATRPTGQWSALSAVAAVCRRSPPDVAAAGRRRSLSLLAQGFHDSRRWSILLTEGFVPPFEAWPEAQWGAELARYEQDFDRAAAAVGDGGDRLRLEAELAWGRLGGRLALGRGRDWLTPEQRAEVEADLARLIEAYGGLPLPGEAPDGAARTVGDRAREALQEFESLAFGRPGPDIAASSLEGEELALADFRGRIVILDFWTSFCAPCLALVPHTRSLLERLDGEPVVVLGVCGDQDREQGRATARRLGMMWPSFWDGPTGPEGPIARAWHVTGWPSIHVLDAEGRIRFRFHDREAAEAGLEAAVRTLLAGEGSK